MEVDVRALREIACRPGLVPRALELLATPEEDALRFDVELEVELRADHARCFGRDRRRVVPPEGDSTWPFEGS